MLSLSDDYALSVYQIATFKNKGQTAVIPKDLSPLGHYSSQFCIDRGVMIS